MHVSLTGVVPLGFLTVDRHPYGHGKYEALGSLSIGAILLASAGGLAWHAGSSLTGAVLAPPPAPAASAEVPASSLANLTGHSHGGGEGWVEECEPPPAFLFPPYESPHIC